MSKRKDEQIMQHIVQKRNRPARQEDQEEYSTIGKINPRKRHKVSIHGKNIRINADRANDMGFCQETVQTAARLLRRNASGRQLFEWWDPPAESDE